MEVETATGEPIRGNKRSYKQARRRSIGNKAGLRAELSETGQLLNLRTEKTVITRTLGSLTEGGLGRIYLRTFSGSKTRLIPVSGPQSICRRYQDDRTKVQWEGAAEGVEVTVDLLINDDQTIDWQVQAAATDSSVEAIDCIFGLDIGLADEGAVQSNEAYVCHYVDQQVETTDAYGPVLMYRQNLPQSNGNHPWLLIYSPTHATAFGTDAHAEFGNSYRLDNQPKFANGDALTSTLSQYEYNYALLQSRRLDTSSGKECRFNFKAVFVEDHPEVSSESDLEKTVNPQISIFPTQSNTRQIQVCQLTDAIPYPAKDCTESELRELFPEEWRHVERSQGNVLSFFAGCDGLNKETHFVTRKKEGLVDRAHGTILTGATDLFWNPETTATTAYMNGIFGSQVVSGNTSLHKLNSVSRESLGLNRTSGQRIFVRIKDRWYQLLTPTVFATNRDSVRWTYHNPDLPSISVELSITHNNRDIDLNLKSSRTLDEVIITNELTIGNNESDLDATIHWDGISGVCEIYPNKQDESSIPGFRLVLSSNCEQPAEDCSKRIGAPANLLCLSCTATSTINLSTRPILDNKEVENKHFWDLLSKGLNFRHSNQSVENLDTALKWYAHNAIIHYLSPHGLEQYSGAAWGTRDACQGPFELLLSQGHFDACKDILRRTFSAQYLETGDWPQWFMLDEYAHIAQNHSHGDIILWPLRALALYLLRTKDFDFLNEDIDFRLREPVNVAANSPKSLFDHMEMAIEHMVAQFAGDTQLISYGDGDWDDSLQPAQTSLRKRLVSSWTVALSAQVATELADGLKDSPYPQLVSFLLDLRKKIERDFHKYLLMNGTLCGFLLFDENFENPQPLIHPDDSITGIGLRLIPINRAIISGLFSKQEAEYHLNRVEEELKYPDGVRLMTKPATYSGGKENFFRRAESAANFGREIGLQYVHAHIRYAEALSIIGKADEFWEALKVINPVGIQEVVPNAGLRQSNMYFSSSDGDFNTRYEAAENMDRLKSGDIQAKGGWRLYSSGPGIYTSIVIERLLGLREFSNHWEIDPVLPESLNNLQVDWEMDACKVRITYVVSGTENQLISMSVNGSDLTGEPVRNPYRQAGIRISKASLKALMHSGQNEIVIKC